MNHTFASVMGTMGSGKTTIANLIAQECEYTLVLEQFENNPFLPKFYADMKRWAFHSQMFFLLEKAKQLHGIPSLLQQQSVIQDTPIMQDVYHTGRRNTNLETWIIMSGICISKHTKRSARIFQNPM